MAILPLKEFLIKQWHSFKNDTIAIDKVTAGSKRKVWWIDVCGHEWEATIADRMNSKNTGCPYCSGRRLLKGVNDLAFKNPILTLDWHPNKNNNLLPDQVFPNSNKKAWWLGRCGHEWEACVSARNRGIGCPVCYGRALLPGYNDLATTHPQTLAEWHPTRNYPLTPTEIGRGSQRKIWWICAKGHEWKTSPNSRTGKGITDCPTCAGRNILVGFNDLPTTHPEIAAQWHPTKNLPVVPSDVNHGSRMLIWWACDIGHEWKTPLYNKRKGKIGCAICAGQKVLKGFNDLATINPKLAEDWHPTKNGDLAPTMVTSNSTKRIWWNCILNHTWQAKVNTRHASFNGCPVCSGHTVLSGFNDFHALGGNLLSQWNPTRNLPLTPQDITMGSNKKVWWICNKGHEWEVRIPDRKRGEGCPTCCHSVFVSKSEQDIADFLISQGLDVEQSNRKLIGKELDIYIPEKKIAIEYNGVYWHSEKAGKSTTYHHDKWLAAKNAGIQLIQVWEDEWKRNPKQVKAMLLHKLGISNQEKVFARNTMVSNLVKSDVESFLNLNHVQGYASGSYYLGLRDKETSELVSVMVLKKASNNTLNIVRYVTSKHVVGGFTKLLKHAELSLSPARFVTSSDNCVSDGSLYAGNGFTAGKELAPDYRYVVKGEREHKSGYRLKRFREDPLLQWQDGLTEKELADLNSIPRIWDAGRTRWVKTIL